MLFKSKTSLASEMDTHSACVISNNNDDATNPNGVDLLRLTDFPTVVSDCRLKDNEWGFVNRMRQSVTIGCALFVVTHECVMPFLDNFHDIHDWVEQKYVVKVLVVIDTDGLLAEKNVTDLLTHRIVIDELPLAQVIKYNVLDETLDISSAYPFSSVDRTYNRFFIRNSSFEHDKDIIPKITDLNGMPVYGAFISYPPYSEYYSVPAGTGDANEYGSNESLSLKMDGQELILLVQFCVTYNCILMGQLDYDIELWGDVYPNHTGYGLTGAVGTRKANVSCAALYLWDNPHYFTQYSPVIQRATITLIVPKPLPLPYWQTPLLPFPGHIWGFVIVSFMTGAAGLFVVNVVQNRIEIGQGPYGLFDSIYAVFTMSLFHGVNINIKFISNIVIFTVILVFALVIGNLYVGEYRMERWGILRGLASVMTITRYEKPVDRLEELVESKFMWGATSPAWILSLLHSDYPPHKKFVANFFSADIPDVLKLVQEHRMAVMLETTQYGTLSYQAIIDPPASKYYMLLKEPVYWQGTVIMASKMWPFMEQLNQIVLMQQESGINYYWEQGSAYRLMNYQIQRNIMENGRPPDGAEPVKLSIQHILGALFLWMFGNTASVISFLIEVLWHYNEKKMVALLRSFRGKIRKLKN